MSSRFFPVLHSAQTRIPRNEQVRSSILLSGSKRPAAGRYREGLQAGTEPADSSGMSTSRPARILRSVLMVCLIVVGLAAIWSNTRRDPEAKFCTMALAFVVIDGKQVVLEDQGSGGRGSRRARSSSRRRWARGC